MAENMEQSPAPIHALPIPVMHQERFAELSGVSRGVLEGWVNRGYIPTIVIGKHRLINLVELTQSCIEQLPR